MFCFSSWVSFVVVVVSLEVRRHSDIQVRVHVHMCPKRLWTLFSTGGELLATNVGGEKAASKICSKNNNVKNGCIWCSIYRASGLKGIWCCIYLPLGFCPRVQLSKFPPAVRVGGN